MFLFALAGSSVGDRVLPGATEQTESQLYGLGLGFIAKRNLGTFWEFSGGLRCIRSTARSQSKARAIQSPFHSLDACSG